MKKIVAGLAAVLALGLAAPSVHAASCAAIKSAYHSKVKPRMASAVRSSPVVASQYRLRLRQNQRGSNPTRAEIRRTSNMVMKDCNTRSDRGSCRNAVRRLTAAAYGVHDQHRKWARKKCAGVLTVR